MCFYEMSLLEEYQTQDEYRHALRDALKYAERFRKKDKDLEYVGNYEDYWMSLNEAAMEQAMNQYEMGDFRKAKRTYDRMTGYMPQNAGAWRMLAICQQRANQNRDALVSLKQADEAQKLMGPVDRLPPDQRKLLRASLIKHAEYMVEQGDRSGAREVLALGEEDFMSNTEFKGLYNALN
jgi:tetratricopeptide (TPR) repeat protein